MIEIYTSTTMINFISKRITNSMLIIPREYSMLYLDSILPKVHKSLYYTKEAL